MGYCARGRLAGIHECQKLGKDLKWPFLESSTPLFLGPAIPTLFQTDPSFKPCRRWHSPPGNQSHGAPSAFPSAFSHCSHWAASSRCRQWAWAQPWAARGRTHVCLVLFCQDRVEGNSIQTHSLPLPFNLHPMQTVSDSLLNLKGQDHYSEKSFVATAWCFAHSEAKPLPKKCSFYSGPLADPRAGPEDVVTLQHSKCILVFSKTDSELRKKKSTHQSTVPGWNTPVLTSGCRCPISHGQEGAIAIVTSV